MFLCMYPLIRFHFTIWRKPFENWQRTGVVCLSASLSHLMIFIIIFCLVSQSNTLYSKRKIHNSGHNGAKAEVVLYFLLFLLYHYLLSLVIVQHFVFKTKNDNSGHNWAKVILKSYYIFYIISTNSLRGCFKPFTFEE